MQDNNASSSHIIRNYFGYQKQIINYLTTPGFDVEGVPQGIFQRKLR